MKLILISLIVLLSIGNITNNEAKAENPSHLKQLMESKKCPKCDLKKADLMLVNLEGADLNQVDLSNANLFLAKLKYANLEKANLTNANLTGANLEKANLTDANLTGADLTGASLIEVNFSGALWIDGKKKCAPQSIGVCK